MADGSKRTTAGSRYMGVSGPCQCGSVAGRDLLVLHAPVSAMGEHQCLCEMHQFTFQSMSTLSDVSTKHEKSSLRCTNSISVASDRNSGFTHKYQVPAFLSSSQVGRPHKDGNMSKNALIAVAWVGLPYALHLGQRSL